MPRVLLVSVSLILLVAVCSSITACQVRAPGESILPEEHVVVQTTQDGRPFRCWKIVGLSLYDLEASYLLAGESLTGREVRLSGNYMYIQKGDSWEGAFAELGLTEELCTAIQNRWKNSLLEQGEMPRRKIQNPS